MTFSLFLKIIESPLGYASLVRMRFEAIKDDDDGDDDYSGKVKTPKKTPKKSKAATPKRGKGGKVEKRGRPAKAETPAKKTPAKKSKSPAKKAKTPKKETPKKVPVKKDPPKLGINFFRGFLNNAAPR